tara:strand:+ start:2157 stop:2282 length:126 start_codon:yes stop_codon:yes gene_type:complete
MVMVRCNFNLNSHRLALKVQRGLAGRAGLSRLGRLGRPINQ